MATPSGSTIGEALDALIADENMEDAEGATISEPDDEPNLHRTGSADSEQEQANKEPKVKRFKAHQRESPDPERPNSEIGIVIEPAETAGEVESNGEYGETEEVVDGAELDVGARNEESRK